MRYSEVINISKNTYLYSIFEKKLPMKIKLPLLFNIKKIKEVMSNWEMAFAELVKQYANKDEDGNVIIINEKYDIPIDKINDYTREFNDILNCNSGLSKKDLQYIPMTYFEDYDETKYDVLTINEMESLLFMIE